MKSVNNNIEQSEIKLFIDQTPLLALYAYQKLGLPLEVWQVLFSVGFVYKGKLIGILVWTDYRYNHDVWWTIYTWDKHWCTKKVISTMFKIAREALGCIRVNVLTKTRNQKVNTFLTRLGFVKEGCLKKFFYPDQSDAYLWGIFL